MLYPKLCFRYSRQCRQTKIPLISIPFSSLVLIFVLVLVSSTTIQNVFVIFVIVIVVVDEKNTDTRLSQTDRQTDELHGNCAKASCANERVSECVWFNVPLDT